MKKYLSVLFLIVFIIPSIAFASWWNPFTWKIFNRSSEVKIERPIAPPVNPIDTSNQTPKEEPKKLDQSTEIEKLKKEVTELKAKSETIKTTKPTITSKIINAIPQSPTPTNNEKKCGGITYQNGCSANEGTAEIYFYCSPLGEARCTDLDTLNKLTNGSLVFCNKKTYTACPIGYTLSCTVTGATCVSGKPAVQQPVVSSNGLTEQQRIDEMLKILDNQIAEKHRQTEIALQQLYADQEEMEQRQEPIKNELDILSKKIEEECPVSVYIGSQAQQCNVWRADAGILIAKISAITREYNSKLGIKPSLDFTTQQSVSGQHYEYYYDGYGSGSIYNTSNPADSYKIYCKYGKCDIYGN